VINVNEMEDNTDKINNGDKIENTEKINNIKKIKRKDLKNTKKESDNYYVPYRNSIFLIYALGLAENLFIKEKKIFDIFVGFKNEGKEGYPDTTDKYVRIINKLGEFGIKKIKIFAPLIKKDKDEIILLGKKLGVDFKDSFSCYINNKIHCGVCLACRLRQEAFYWSNVRDPTDYKEKMKDFRLAE